jgi:hypothetical protein
MEELRIAHSTQDLSGLLSLEGTIDAAELTDEDLERVTGGMWGHMGFGGGFGHMGFGGGFGHMGFGGGFGFHRFGGFGFHPFGFSNTAIAINNVAIANG